MSIGAGIGAAVGSLAGAFTDLYSSHRAADRNENLQRDFANNGVSMRVADAMRAGIHPLYALGAQAPSASPVAVGSNLSGSLAAAGQDIGRALAVTKTERERAEMAANLAIERSQLENELLKAKIKETLDPGAPPLPSNSGMSGLTGQGSGYTYNGRTIGGSPYVIEQPLTRVHSQPGRPGQEVGMVPGYGYYRTATGIGIAPGKDIKERIEDQLIPELVWAWQHQVKPFFKGLPAPDPKYYDTKPGHEWKWNWYEQEFQEVPKYPASFPSMAPGSHIKSQPVHKRRW